MKQFKIIAIFLLAIIVVVFLGIFIILKTTDINSFRDQITNKISESIDRNVSIGHISLKCSLGQGVTLDISGLTVMDNPDFSSDPIFYADSTHLNIDILPFIFERKVVISNVKLDSLKVNIVRNSEGDLNVQDLSGRPKDQKSGIQKDAAQSLLDSSGNNTEKGNKAFTFGDILIRSVLVNDGAIIFTDQTTSPETVIPVEQINFQVTNFSLDEAFPFQMKASLWSDKKNIRINGLSQINVENQQVRIDDLNIQFDGASIDIDEINKNIPSFKEAGIEDKIGGRLVIDTSQAILGKNGLLVLSTEGHLTDGRFDYKDLPFPIEDLSIRFELSESDLEITEIKAPIASGELNLSGRIGEYVSEQEFSGDLNIANMHLSELTVQMDLPVKMEGKINGSLKGSGQGLSRSDLESSLVGEGTVEVAEGRLLDINILELVLSKLSFVPNLVDQVEANLPDKYKEKLTQKDTVLQKVLLDIRIRDRVLVINQVELNADGFLVIAKGNLDFDQNMYLEADLYIVKDLSESMTAASEELNYLLDERGQIHIPFKPYRGSLDKFRMYPDVGDLGQKVIKNRGKEELKKALYKVLDIESQSPEPLPEDDTKEPQEEEVSPEDAIIENILDMIPIFE